MKFEIQTAYTFETVTALVAVNQARQGTHSRVRAARFIVRLCGVLFTLMGAAALLLQAMDLFHVPYLSGLFPYNIEGMFAAAVQLGMGLLLLRPRRKQDLSTAKAIWKNYPNKEMKTVFTFYSDCFWYKTSVSECRYDYSVLQDIWTDGTYYFLYINQRDAYVLKKADFTQGDPAAFGALLSQWTGKPVQSNKKTSDKE